MRGIRLLLVEDEHKIASSIKRGLEQENYSVDVTYDGIKGYDLASTEEYDAIILDLMLPGISGLDLCKKLREQKINTPIIILTAKSELEDKIKGLNTGADDYLTKPFAFEELLARMRAVLRRPSSSLNSILKFEDLTLDTVNFTVARNGSKIALSKKEFSLLEYLMRNPGKILTKENIVNHVWDYDADVLPNTVEQYIGYLRKKVDKVFPDCRKLINTERGFGYKLG
jgi:DNA-binding response OmpR family regulator